MKPKYPVNKFTIIYNYISKKFYMFDKDDQPVGEDINGRELGRDAWELHKAQEVCYNYDLGLDENLPLIPRHEKYKTRN